MEISEIPKKVCRTKIRTRGLSSNTFAGQYHSAFKSRGMALPEVRKYQFGDDIHDVDWNVTARSSKLFVRVLEEERELAMILMVDVFGSLGFSTVKQLKKDMAAEIAAILVFSVTQNNDKIGVISFSDRIKEFIPLKKGHKHILHTIRESVDLKPESRRTNVRPTPEYLTNVMKRCYTAFILSNLIDQESSKNVMTVANRKHDVVAIQVYDGRVAELSAIGLMRAKDAETGHKRWIGTSLVEVRKVHHERWVNEQAELDEAFTKGNVDSVSAHTSQGYVKALLNLFTKRN